ncbi:MAG: hypothetical protein VX331_03325, partial [Candidatus Thermoplasmatota archaeon]|nr:hypothetical protein [Candidatus Thermoplasmatota archaeon]
MSSISLLVVSDLDVGSTVQGDALLNRGGWKEMDSVDGGRVWHHSSSSVHLWWRAESHLFSDHLDETYRNSTGFEISEVLFLSRHVAASGLPSLTLHA